MINLRNILPHKVTVEQARISLFKTAADRPWLYIGWIPKNVGRGLTLACRCGIRPIDNFDKVSDYDTLEIKSFPTVDVCNKIGIRVRGTTTGLLYFLDFLVGQCERCESIYWGLIDRHVCTCDENSGIIYEVPHFFITQRNRLYHRHLTRQQRG